MAAPKPTVVDRHRRAIRPPELHHLVEHWGAVADRLREDGLQLAGSLVAQALPTAVTASGVVTLEADTPAVADGVEARRDEILAATRSSFRVSIA